MDIPRPGNTALLTAPVAAVAATLLLVAITGQILPVLMWGALVTLLAAVPVITPTRRRRAVIWACTALVFAVIAFSILSIGVYFVPALIALVIAGATHRREPVR